MEKEKIVKLAKEYYELYKEKKRIEDRLFAIKYLLVQELGEGMHKFGDVAIYIRKGISERFNTKLFKSENPDIYSFYTYKSEWTKLIVEIQGEKENGV